MTLSTLLLTSYCIIFKVLTYNFWLCAHGYLYDVCLATGATRKFALLEASLSWLSRSSSPSYSLWWTRPTVRLLCTSYMTWVIHKSRTLSAALREKVLGVLQHGSAVFFLGGGRNCMKWYRASLPAFRSGLWGAVVLKWSSASKITLTVPRHHLRDIVNLKNNF